jgi:hypothetical protein
MARVNARRGRRPKSPRPAVRTVPNPIFRARIYESACQGGSRSYAQVAKEFGVAREEVCQYVALVRRLPSAIVSHLEHHVGEACPSSMSLRTLLSIARLPTEPAKLATFARLVTQSGVGPARWTHSYVDEQVLAE